jgi:hypothetical protein
LTLVAKRTTTQDSSAMHSHVKTRSMSSKEPSMSVRVMLATVAQSGAGPTCSICMPGPIAMRSADRLSVFVPNFTRATAPRDLPVASAVRSQISCTAIWSGRVKGTADSMP